MAGLPTTACVAHHGVAGNPSRRHAVHRRQTRPPAVRGSPCTQQQVEGHHAGLQKADPELRKVRQGELMDPDGSLLVDDVVG